MNFGTWFELGEARRVAPLDVGVVQARSASLRQYPAGRSAMVFYGASGADETLRDYVVGRGVPALERAAALGAGLIRFGATAVPDVALATLLRRFEERFGAPPVANQPADAATTTTTTTATTTKGATRDV